MHFEDLLAEAGGFGLYQKVLCFVLIPFTTGIVGLVYTCQLIVLSVPRYRCDQNQSLETLISAEDSALLDTDVSHPKVSTSVTFSLYTLIHVEFVMKRHLFLIISHQLIETEPFK
jgi:hypothetical protein